MLETLGEASSAKEQETLRRHVEDCSVCQAQLERLGWVAPVVREVSRRGYDPDDHPSDLELARFADEGFSADGSDEIIEHLSRCRRCRDTLTTAWSAVGDHEPRPSADRQRSATASQAAAGSSGTMCGLGALLSFAGECILLVIAVSQIALAWLIEPVSFEAVPSVWPLSLVPAGAMRFWVLVSVCLLGAGLLRWATGRLYSCATYDTREGPAAKSA
jgi:hypothetical protein